MSEPYIGEIRMFAGNFPPRGWEFCDGQVLAIEDNDTLFALLGTTYGGDGQFTFALPDLRGRMPMHQGRGRIVAEAGGDEQVTLGVTQLPPHTHPVNASGLDGTTGQPTNAVPAHVPGGVTRYSTGGSPVPTAVTTGEAGGSQPHENMSPFVAVNFIISMFGIYPSQT